MDDPGLCIDKVRNNVLIKCWGIIVIIIIIFFTKKRVEASGDVH